LPGNFVCPSPHLGIQSNLHTSVHAPSFIFDHPGHFMPADTVEIEKRLWDAADDLRAIPKLNRSIFDAF
jgi:hypothetical protein